MMRMIVWMCLALFCSGIYAFGQAPQDIYLLIGQSNMAGRAPFGEEDAGVIDRCFLLNGEDQWEPAKNPLNRYSTIRKNLGMQKMNPGYMFSKTMLAANPDLSIGLVVNAQGGTRIEQWEKGTEFYSEALRRVKEARKTGTLKGILWHQGEANHKDGYYLEKLKRLVTDLRTDLGMPDLPFVAGKIRREAVVNDQIAELPDALPNTAVVSSEGLTTLDEWHFDTESMKTLGCRYAEAMMGLQ